MPSPNFNERKKGKIPKYIIMHYTDTLDIGETMKYLLGGVSAHYLVDRDGSIIKLVDEDMRAWHAGVSYWQDDEDINSSSIGIEIQNSGDRYGYIPFLQEQIDAVIELTKDIMERQKIPAENIIGHSDIAPDRKIDPGELFPWEELSKHGIGIWPEAKDIESAEVILSNKEKIEELLQQIGYAPISTELTFNKLITAFQRHFEPEVFFKNDSKNIGIPSANTIALMLNLTKKILD